MYRKTNSAGECPAPLSEIEMFEAKPSGQLVRVLDVEMNPWMGPKRVTVGAETFCCAEDKGFSGVRKFVLSLGEKATVTVSRDIFPNVKMGDTLDGHLFAYYKMREPKELSLAA